MRPFACKLNIPLDQMPDLVVGNCYGEETEHIGEHTDTHKFFDGLNGNCVIVSINIAQDGLFYGRLRFEKNSECVSAAAKDKHQELLNELHGMAWPGNAYFPAKAPAARMAAIEAQLGVKTLFPVAANENSVTVMTGMPRPRWYVPAHAHVFMCVPCCMYRVVHVRSMCAFVHFSTPRFQSVMWHGTVPLKWAQSAIAADGTKHDENFMRVRAFRLAYVVLRCVSLPASSTRCRRRLPRASSGRSVTT